MCKLAGSTLSIYYKVFFFDCIRKEAGVKPVQMTGERDLASQTFSCYILAGEKHDEIKYSDVI